MLTPEIIARVDAWLEKHSSPAWQSRWRHMTSARGLALLSGRTEEAATAEAALHGILLALVREAWGDVAISNVDGIGIAVTSIFSRNAIPPMVFGIEGRPVGERLAAALEAAPCR